MNTEVVPGQSSEKRLKGESNDELPDPLIPTVTLYTGQTVHLIWPEVLPFIERAAEWGRGEYQAVDVLVMAASEKMQIWVFRQEGRVTLVCVTQLLQHPRLKVCNIYALAGRHMAQLWGMFFPQILPWLRLHGVDEVQTTCRQEIAAKIKPFGFEPLVQVLRLNLKELS